MFVLRIFYKAVAGKQRLEDKGHYFLQEFGSSTKHIRRPVFLVYPYGIVMDPNKHDVHGLQNSDKHQMRQK
jgi:hypothetical protein